MRAFGISAGVAVLSLFGFVALAQNGTSKVEPTAPTDKAAAWSKMEMTAINKEMAVTKELTHRLFKEKAYNLEVRRLAGPQPILQHGKKSDFMVIQDGEGTFMSGGELVNAKAAGEDQGDMRGESIRGGVTRVLKPGDVMYVPAGLPHGFVSTKDHVTFIMVRFDTK